MCQCGYINAGVNDGCYCGDELNDKIHWGLFKDITARNEHECDICGWNIGIGERYQCCKRNAYWSNSDTGYHRVHSICLVESK